MQDELVLLIRHVVPMFDQRQVLLDFVFDKSQSGLKLFLARKLEACLFVLGVSIFGGDGPCKVSDEVDLGRSGFVRRHVDTLSQGGQIDSNLSLDSSNSSKFARMMACK
jgi:hypothetical protein